MGAIMSTGRLDGGNDDLDGGDLFCRLKQVFDLQKREKKPV